jgi:hypothetical protein
VISATTVVAGTTFVVVCWRAIIATANTGVAEWPYGATSVITFNRGSETDCQYATRRGA